jgi:hypothetical protein
MEQANLKWIQLKWAEWLKTEVAMRYLRGNTPRYHCEHIAQLFAAFCMDKLQAEK